MAQYLKHISRYRSVIDKIAARYHRYGGSQYTIGEPLSIVDHSIQTAKLMADASNNEPLSVTSALLHDFGHVCRGKPIDPFNCKDDKHEYIASSILKSMGFPWVVYEPIKQHVNAKRFLAVDDTYRDGLSKGSQQSLKLQGGVMTLQEELHFYKHPLFKEIIELREMDDNAKDTAVTANHSGINEFSHQLMEALAMRDVEKQTKKRIITWFTHEDTVNHRKKALSLLHADYLNGTNYGC